MSPSIKERIQEAIKLAMRAREKERLGVLRLILSEFKRVEVDERITLDVTRELAILDKMQKQRRDAMEQFEKGGRPALAQKEQFEFDTIQSFKPQALSEEEVEQHILQAVATSNAQGPQEMGKVMALLKPALQGRADIGQVSARVKALLSDKAAH